MNKLIIKFKYCYVLRQHPKQDIPNFGVIMIYTKYFAILTKENGQPNLSNEQFRRMMNIISIEGIIQGMKRIKEKYKNTQGYYKYDMDIFKHQRVLTSLTGNLKAEDLFKEMMRFSRD